MEGDALAYLNPFNYFVWELYCVTLPFTLGRAEYEILREFKWILWDLSYSTLHITSEFGSQSHWLKKGNKTSTTANEWKNSLTLGKNIKADRVVMWITTSGTW